MDGFVSRAVKDVTPLDPDLVISFYGMNDGAKPQTRRNFDPSTRLLAAWVKNNLQAKMILASPGRVDDIPFNRIVKQTTAKDFNHILRSLASEADQIAKGFNLSFAPVHDVIEKAYGLAITQNHLFQYTRDGVHYEPAGELLTMAACLPSLKRHFETKPSAPLAEYSLDWSTGTWRLSQGHHPIDSATAPKRRILKLKSSRYPFCFNPTESGDVTGANRLLAAKVLDFDEQHNQFRLQIDNLPNVSRLVVKWGSENRSFTREALEEGVNLSKEFRTNPFSKPFKAYHDRVKNGLKTHLNYSQRRRGWKAEHAIPVPDVEHTLEIFEETLSGNVSHISTSTGGTQNLSITMGAQFKGYKYWIVGSYKGTSPGFDYQGFHMPLVKDMYFHHTLTQPGTNDFLENSVGLLDRQGQGGCVFKLPPNGSYKNLVLNHVAVIFNDDNQVVHVSQPLKLELR